MSMALIRAGAAAMQGARRRAGGPVTAWSTDGLVLAWHVRESTVTQVDDGGTPRISLLADSWSGGVDLSEGTMGQRPEYLPTGGYGGRPGARWSSVRQDCLRGTAPALTAGPRTVYFFGEMLAIEGVGSRYIVDIQTGRQVHQTFNGSWSAYNGSQPTGGAASTGEQSVVWTLTGGTATSTIHVDGALSGSAFDWTNMAMGGGIAIGNRGAGDFSNITPDMIVSDILIYTGAHDAAVRAANLAAGVAGVMVSP